MFAAIRTACLATVIAVCGVALPAHADDGVWKVGDSYVIRFETLDLSQPTDRLSLLSQVERAAQKLCEGQRPLSSRRACAAEAVSQSSKALPPHLRAGLDIARFERDGQQQAQR
jgi:UrcA family protein